MGRKNPLKYQFFAILFSAVTLIFLACSPPVNIEIFLEDKKVQDYIETLEEPDTTDKTATINISFTIADLADSSSLILAPSALSISQIQLYNGPGLAILINSGPAGYNSSLTRWVYNGTVAASGGSPLSFSRAANFNYLAAGEHHFTVYITVNGIEYSKLFIVEVLPSEYPSH